MKFDPGDKNDKRVQASPFALHYPADLDKVPGQGGVYMFIDAADAVVFVGATAGGPLKAEIESKKGTPAELGATRCRWFRTASDEVSRSVQTDWVKKYQPQNN